MELMPDRRPKRGRWVLILVGLGVGLMFLLFCSGLHFPVWDGRGRLQGHLTRDFNVSLPASARVTRAVRVAYRDPGEFYAVEMARADVGAFVAAVKGAGNSPREGDASESWTMGAAPDWWRPQGLPGGRRLDVFHHDQLGGYILYYSQSAATVYVFWFRT